MCGMSQAIEDRMSFVMLVPFVLLLSFLSSLIHNQCLFLQVFMAMSLSTSLSVFLPHSNFARVSKLYSTSVAIQLQHYLQCQQYLPCS